MRTTLLVAFIVLTAGCTERARPGPGTDFGPPLDARVDDGGVFDGAPPMDLAIVGRDGSPPVDAARGDASVVDAGSDLTPTAVCTRICGALVECDGSADVPTCVEGCTPDVGDCSPAQLRAIIACETAGCAMGPDLPAVAECLIMVSCISGGGGPVDPPPPPPPPPPPA